MLLKVKSTLTSKYCSLSTNLTNCGDILCLYIANSCPSSAHHQQIRHQKSIFRSTIPNYKCFFNLGRWKAKLSSLMSDCTVVDFGICSLWTQISGDRKPFLFRCGSISSICPCTMDSVHTTTINREITVMIWVGITMLATIFFSTSLTPKYQGGVD